ncbi:MAG: MTAP family purine nucleoside phosphorylase [Armatimonadetes bacterium]|nr:MTAP family purine nucleoside phosphorylase [Armatimonadota bacterium]
MSSATALIGGSGIGHHLAALGGELVHVPTQFGLARFRRLVREGTELWLVERHGSGHKVPPAEVNYRAMAVGLKSVGVMRCISTAAVGSLRTEWKAGTCAVCTDIIDLSGRNLTLFEQSVQHTDISHPFDRSLSKALGVSLSKEGLSAFQPCVYACTNGPRYESPAEVAAIRGLGADVVGMTLASEAVAMAEAGVALAAVAMVTNLAAGLSRETLNHAEVVQEVERISEKVAKAILSAACSTQ